MILFTLCLVFSLVLANESSEVDLKVHSQDSSSQPVKSQDGVLTVYGVNPNYGHLHTPFSEVSAIDVYEGPLLILVDLQNEGGNQLYGKTLTTFFTPNGLKSLANSSNLRKFYDYVLQVGNPQGIAFFAGDVYYSSFLKNYITNMYLPDKFTIQDFVEAVKAKYVPILYVFSKSEFENYQFAGLDDLGSFTFGKQGVEPFHLNLQNAVVHHASESYNYPGNFPSSNPLPYNVAPVSGPYQYFGQYPGFEPQVNTPFFGKPQLNFPFTRPGQQVNFPVVGQGSQVNPQFVGGPQESFQQKPVPQQEFVQSQSSQPAFQGESVGQSGMPFNMGHVSSHETTTSKVQSFGQGLF